jgi:CDP-4-dehydro-6-deoxyglucose reductase
MAGTPVLLGAPAERPRPRPPLTANATLVGREHLTEDVQIILVMPDDGPLPFQPGQYMSLGLPYDGGWLQRPYSPSGSPRGVPLEFLVRQVSGGQLTPRLWATNVGSRLRIGPAKGIFRLTPDDRRAHLFVATGTGIAPIVAMAAALTRHPAPPPTIVLHGVRHEQELAYRDRLQRWAAEAPRFSYVPAVSRAGPGSSPAAFHCGRALDLLPEVWAGFRLQPDGVIAYLCGNPAVVDGAAEWLVARGVAVDAIRREEYWATT